MSGIRISGARRVALMLPLALVVTACGASVAERDLGRPPRTSSAAPSPEVSASAPAESVAASPEAAAVPVASVVVPDGDVLPRAVIYGILEWTVTDAAITNQDPATYVAGAEGEPTDSTSLIVDLEIRNDSPHVAFVTTTSRLVAELPDGSIVPGKDLGRPSAPPSSTVESRYAFEVPADTAFDGLLLRFEDPGREPSLDLPLSGVAPAVEANLTTELGEATPIGLPGIEMQWTLDTAITGHDWPLPVGFKGGTRVAGARAELGHRWVGIVARVDVDRCDCKGGVLDQAGSARLLVDGSPFTASAGESSKAIMQSSTFSDVMLVFDIPADAGDAVLQVGPLEEPDQQATIPLDLD